MNLPGEINSSDGHLSVLLEPIEMMDAQLVPQNVHKQENVYTLKEVWESSADGSHQPPHHHQNLPCNEAAFWKFNSHGCCDDVDLFFPQEFQLSQLLEQWANKSVLFFGDSISQQTIEALLNSAHAEGIEGTSNYASQVWKQHGTIAYMAKYNITIISNKDNGGAISPVNGATLVNATYPSLPGDLETALQESDIAYVNFGLHLANSAPAQCGDLFRYTRDVLEKDMVEHPEKRHFYRLTLPQHFSGTDGKGRAFRDVDVKHGMCVGYGQETDEHWTSVLARDIFYGSKVAVLNYHDFLAPRGDLHSLRTDGNVDCSHWCWNYEMWRGVWYLMYHALQ
jgi:hypothetical protein